MHEPEHNTPHDLVGDINFYNKTTNTTVTKLNGNCRTGRQRF